MKTLAISLLLFGCAHQVEAALSPLSQNIKEMKEILNDAYIASHIPQNQTIDSLTLVEATNDFRIYRIDSLDSSIFAKLTYIKSAKLGPRSYTIEWSEESK